MGRLIIWILWLVFLLFLCIAQSRRILLTPQFGFIACFIPQAIFMLSFVDKWDVDFSNETMFALLASTGLFFVVSMFCMWFYLRIHNSGGLMRRYRPTVIEEPIYVSNTVLAVLFGINVIEIILWLYYVSILTPGNTWIEKFAYIAHIGKFGDLEDKIRFPFLLNQMKAFCEAGGYMTGYLLLHGVIMNNKGNRVLLLLNTVCLLINMFLSGNRGPFVVLFIMTIVQAYFIYGKSKEWRFHIKFKTLFLVTGLGIIILCALYWTLSWFGRTSSRPMVDYLGAYLSAPLKNFDSFVREGNFGTDWIYSETFRRIINSFGHLLGLSEWQRNLELPFRNINGYSLGNVYTVFYCYLHDFGYAGLFGLTGLMAVISQATYLKLVYGKKQKIISITLIVYSYMYQGILLSFFSDRFYFSICTMSMIKYLLSWWLLRIILTKVKAKKKKTVFASLGS